MPKAQQEGLSLSHSSMPIRLLVFDIDGVLTRGEAKALDLDLLQRLAAMNRAARNDPSLPAVTLCTGRPAPYVEMMLQAIDGHLPGVFENGAGLYVPDGYQFLPHPEVARRNNMLTIRSRLQAGMVDSGQAYFQPGKEYSLTLFSSDPAQTLQLEKWATVALGPLRDDVDLVYSVSCINVLPHGIDKGKGLEFLAEQTGYTFEEMLGVGDSDVDPPFLSLVGRSAAPTNANQAVKDMVDYVSTHPTSEGVRDILEHFGVPV